jgi:hypothetical protein
MMDGQQARQYHLTMRLSAGTTANGVAAAVLIGLTGVAFGMVVYLGPFGLVLLGLFILFVCTSMSLRDDTPIWGTEVFKARMGCPKSPEQRAALHAEKHALLSSLRFYRWCGLALVVAGAAGFARQFWQ